jgi:translocator protein
MNALRRDFWVLFLLLSACLLAGALGALSTASSVGTWYPSLLKPAWTPPDKWFGPVWTFLYISMALAAWLVWLQRSEYPVRRALTAFCIQLILNAAWSPLFFGLQRVDWAFFCIALMWVWIGVTVFLFKRISRAAFWMMIPYWLWITFAQFLNLEIYRLNVR